MALTIRSKHSDPVPEGVHRAVCFCMCDLGTHYDDRWEKNVHSILVGWELPDEKVEIEKDGQKETFCRTISKRYTASLGKKSNLRKDLEQWRGKAFTKEQMEAFDIKVLLGKPCQLQVLHNTGNDGRVYANISAILPAPKGSPEIKLSRDTQFFSFEENSELSEDIPQWIADMIKSSEEWKALQGEQPASVKTTTRHVGDEVEGDDDGTLPF